jgi:hypothetical protein
MGLLKDLMKRFVETLQGSIFALLMNFYHMNSARMQTTIYS